MAARRIIVTGAGGFIGRHAVSALAADGWDIVAVSRKATPVPGAAQMLPCDLLDPAAMRATLLRAGEASHLLHLAWHDAPQGRWHAPDNLDWVAASLSLARAFAESGGRRILFGGSCAEYDWFAGPMLDEDAPLAPASLYGAAKAATGDLLEAGARAMGLSVTRARIFFVYGPGEPAGRLVPDLLAGISAGRTVRCTDGLQERDYLHAADVGRALALLAGAGAEGAVNLGSGHALPVRDLVAEIARQMGRPDLPQLGAIARKADDPPRLVANNRRLADLGFVPRLDLASGVADTLSRWTGEGWR